MVRWGGVRCSRTTCAVASKVSAVFGVDSARPSACAPQNERILTSFAPSPTSDTASKMRMHGFRWCGAPRVARSFPEGAANARAARARRVAPHGPDARSTDLKWVRPAARAAGRGVDAGRRERQPRTFGIWATCAPPHTFEFNMTMEIDPLFGDAALTSGVGMGLMVGALVRSRRKNTRACRRCISALACVVARERTTHAEHATAPRECAHWSCHRAVVVPLRRNASYCAGACCVSKADG